MRVTAGATDVTTYFQFRLQADGTVATGLTITDFDLWYVRSGAAAAAKVDATALTAADDAHSDNKMYEIAKGIYRIDWPDAAFAAGAREVILYAEDVGGGTSFVEALRVELTGVDVGAISGDSTAANNAELMFDGTGYAGGTTKLQVDLTQVLATTLTEGGAGRLAAAFKKLFDVATPLLVASDAMRGTDSAAPSATALSTATWTNELASALNTLAGHDPGSQLASSAEVTSITNNTRCVRSVPSVIERPDSGSTTYRIELLLYDNGGNMEAPDSAPTIALVNQGGTDRSGRLDNATMSLVSTGRYRAVYTASDSDDLEQLNWTFSVVEGGNTRLYGNTSLVVDTTAVDFTAADRTKLDNVDTIAGNLPNSGSLNDLATILTAIQHGTYGLSALQVLIAALNNLSGAEAQSAAEAALAAYGGAKTTDVSGAHVTTDGKIDGLSIPTAAAIRAEIDANGEFVGEVLGAIAGRQDRNDDGTEIQFYTKGGVLLATRSYSAANKRWTTTWA